ncbi:hypothetical protein ACEV8A_07965 [Vibrio parahaemolyticus]|uniref:hypothetical protein n=1 Tax=Vibrio parahaemolyticus TaxID=670 RepID=UPI000465BF3A|nr:hypothetical protein [Vibrio parahaemolyticus]MBE3854263.1 hypothetical protein [Vibrio parahaemolyticus]MBE4800676.1 hypothetical protein [Vibrio parahaemolyticus]MCX8951416.1 hypothetical protein [Vibrio parahaemolyticus]OKY45478.1 hypothetical protein BT101_12700 [Vibrio parahaemolyticus]HCH0920161.1 hypothetical protein [Vibrio parahaemolyticus]
MSNEFTTSVEDAIKENKFVDHKQYIDAGTARWNDSPIKRAHYVQLPQGYVYFSHRIELVSATGKFSYEVSEIGTDYIVISTVVSSDGTWYNQTRSWLKFNAYIRGVSAESAWGKEWLEYQDTLNTPTKELFKKVKSNTIEI